LKLQRIVIVFSLLVIAFLAVAASGMTLVQEGKPISMIVTGNNPVPSQKVAAEELQYHLEKMTGAVVPIVAEKDLSETDVTLILLGQSKLLKSKGIDTTQLARETFIVKTMDNVLILAGEDGGTRNPHTEPYDSSHVRTGTLFAVYDLLQDQFNVRWIWPGQTGEVIPKRETVEVGDLIIQEAPRMFQRHFRQALRQSAVEEGMKIFPRFIETNKKLLEQMIAESSQWRKRMRLGYSQRFSYGHAFTQWFDRYYEKYPEIFAMQPNGTRGIASDTYPKEFVKMCVSSPKLVDLIVEEFKQRNAENPDYHYVNVVENDGSQGFCVCENCKAWDHQLTEDQRQQLLARGLDGSQIDELYTTGKDGLPISLSNRYFRFYNNLARRLRDVDPEAHVTAYAYSRYRYAPIDLPLQRNIFVGLIGFNRYPMDPKAHRAEVENFMAWKRAGIDRLFFRPNSFFYVPGHGVPWSGVLQMGKDLKMLISNGIVATDFDTLNGHWSTTAPTYYVLARMHWDTETGVENLLDEWCGAFRPAAAPIKEYFDMWEKLYQDRMTGDEAEKVLAKADKERGLRVWKSVGLVFTPEDFVKARRFFDHARALAEPLNDPDLLRRIHVLELGLRHGELMSQSAKFSIAKNYYEEDIYFAEHWPLVQEIYGVREKLLDLHAHDVLWLNYFEIRMHDMFATRIWHDFEGRPWKPVMTPADIKWSFQVDPKGIGEAESWQDKVLEQPKIFNRNPYIHLFYSGWDGLRGMTAWKRKHKNQQPINGWYQIAFTVPQDIATPAATLYIPHISGETAKVWVDGRLLRSINKADIESRMPVVIGLNEAGIQPDLEFRLTIKVNAPKGGGLIGPAYIARPSDE
jgi:hypothetical protein